MSDRDEGRGVTERLMRGSALAAALALPFGLLVLIRRFGVEVPFWDEWDWADLIYRSHTGTLAFADLWAQHNEHRIFLDNLAAVVLDRLGGWSTVREQCFSAILVVLTQLVLWRIVRRTVARDVAPFAFLCGSLFLYNLIQYENFEWGFQMAWFMCNLGTITAIWILTDPPEQPRLLHFAVVPALFASLASSQGLVAWPAGIVALVLSRRGWPAIVAWCAWGALVTVVTRSGIAPTPAGHVAIPDNLPRLGQFTTR